MDLCSVECLPTTKPLMAMKFNFLRLIVYPSVAWENANGTCENLAANTGRPRHLSISEKLCTRWQYSRSALDNEIVTILTLLSFSKPFDCVY